MNYHKLFKPYLRKAGKAFLVFILLSAQVYLVSAFEAHVVNVTARICDHSETRTMGFWKNHYNAYKNCLFPGYFLYLGDYPDDLNIESKEQVKEIFDNANADIMRDMLKGQLLAMKFNICYFGIDTHEGEDFGGMKLNVLVEEADNLLRNSGSTREQQEFIKDLLDYANNLHQIRYCSTVPSWYDPLFAEKKDKEEKNGKAGSEAFVAGLESLALGEEPPAEEPPVEEPPIDEEPPAEEEEPPLGSGPESVPYCGDKNLDDGEKCDEGENNGAECVSEYGSSCDYCSLTCEKITITGPCCGDGNIDEGEECDDSNIEDGDGCSASCILEEILPPATECEPDAQQVCSTGLLGICAAGTQTCGSEGFWGECSQDNQSTDEVCNNGLDDNCDGNVDCDDGSCAEDVSCLPPVPDEPPAGEEPPAE